MPDRCAILGCISACRLRWYYWKATLYAMLLYVLVVLPFYHFYLLFTRWGA